MDSLCELRVAHRVEMNAIPRDLGGVLAGLVAAGVGDGAPKRTNLASLSIRMG